MLIWRGLCIGERGCDLFVHYRGIFSVLIFILNITPWVIWNFFLVARKQGKTTCRTVMTIDTVIAHHAVGDTEAVEATEVEADTGAVVVVAVLATISDQ